MKKTLSLLLVLAMVLSSFSFAFATEAEKTPGEVLKDLGVLAGNAQGDLMLDKELSRQDMIVLLSRLLGAENEAKAFEGKTSFKDVKDPYYVPFMAWAEANELTKGVGEGLFGFGRPVTEKEVAAFMLRALGYTDVKWEDVAAKAAELGLVAKDADLDVNCVRGIMAEITLKALGTKVKDSDKTLAEKLALELPVYELAVEDVTVNTAKSFLVKFNKAVEDTSKIEFSVKRGGTAVTLTAKWNEAKTEATLEGASKLATGDYTVVVTDKTAAEAKELASKALKVEDEKIVTIELNDLLIRTNDFTGVVGFKVLNQYGEDVTNTALSRNIHWTVSTDQGTPTVDYKNGTLTIVHGTDKSYGSQLRNLKQVVINAVDQRSGVVITKTVEVSLLTGALGEVALTGIVDEKGNAVDFVADPTRAYYLTYEAKDVNGNKVDSYAILKSDDILRVYSSYENFVKVVKDDKDGKLVLRLEVQSGADVRFDTPVVFTAVSVFSGKSSTYNATLLKKAKLEKFVLMNPAEEVSVKKSFEIPYEAYDQAGKKITRFDDIAPYLTITNNNVTMLKDVNGNLKLVAKFDSEGLQYIMSNVKDTLTGSFSQISINVKPQAIAQSLDSISAKRAFVFGASAQYDFIYGTLNVKDQYDRDFDMYHNSKYFDSKDGKEYKCYVVATTNAPSVFSLATNVAYEKDNVIKVVAGNTPGVATITFSLVRDNNYDPTDNEGNVDYKVLDTRSVTFYNVDRKDIVGVKASNAWGIDNLYPTSKLTQFTSEDIKGNYVNKVNVRGLLANGMEVNLASSDIFALTSSDSRFALDGQIISVASLGNDATAKTNVTAYVYGQDGSLLSGNVEITAVTEAPVASDIYADYDYDLEKAGKVSNDVVTISDSNKLLNKSIYYYTTDGAKAAADAAFVIGVDTQYGETTGVVKNVVIQKVKSVNGVNGSLTINKNTGVVTGSVYTGEEYVFTAVTNNGLVKVVKVVIE